MRGKQFCRCWTFFIFFFSLMQTIVFFDVKPEFRKDLTCKLWSLWAIGDLLLTPWLILSTNPVSGTINCSLAACNLFTNSSITILDLCVFLISPSPLFPPQLHQAIRIINLCQFISLGLAVVPRGELVQHNCVAPIGPNQACSPETVPLPFKFKACPNP